MTFVWPEALWLLLLVPALIWLYVWVLRRRKRATIRYANLALIKAAMGPSQGWRRHVPPVLMLVPDLSAPQASPAMLSVMCGDGKKRACGKQ